MQTNQISTLTSKEIQLINGVIRKKFGTQNGIESGSYEMGKGGRKKCHITLCNSNSYKPIIMLKRIGDYVKNIIDVDEVYCLGIRIA